MKILQCAVLCLGLFPPAASAQWGMGRKFQPASYSSPSGEYELHVSPSTPNAIGAAHVQLRRRGRLLWEKDLPFTFWKAVVGDDGGSAGYAYTNGIVDSSASGELLVAILGPDGSIRAEESVPRKRTAHIHGSTIPVAGEICWNAEADRLLVEVADGDMNWGRESWWMFRLSDAASLPRQVPEDAMEAMGRRLPGEQEPLFSMHIDAVPETPLFLSHWYCRGADTGVGARFLLTDPDGWIVWSLDLPGDYESDVPNEEDRRRSTEKATEDRSYTAFGPGPRFRIDSLAEATSVTYLAEADSVTTTVNRGSAGAWVVREEKREPFAPKEECPGAEIKLPAAHRSIPLESAGSVEFGVRPGAPSVVRGLVCFDVDDRGQFGVVRRFPGEDGDEFEFDLLSPEGNSLRTFPLRNELGDPWPELQLLWVRGTTWLIAGAWAEDERSAGHAFWLDGSDGTQRDLPGWWVPALEVLARTQDGGFALLGTIRSRYTSEHVLVTYDASGRERWRVGDEPGLFSPSRMWVTPAGDILVLDGIEDELKVFAGDGSLLHTVDLKESPGRVPDSLTQILALEDSPAPPLHRLGLGFGLQESFAPRFEERPVKGYRNLVRGGDGRIWCSDDGAFLELDEHFLVRRIVGSAPDSGVLLSVAGALVDFEGRVFFVDARTGDVHVFASTGEALSVFESRESDFGERVSVGQMGLLPGGGLFVEGKRGVEYDATGRRVGTFKTRGSSTDERVYVPGTTRRWVIRHDALFLEEKNGDVLKKVERTASGDFFWDPGPMAIAPNGVLAFCNLVPPAYVKDSRGSVFLYDADGEEIATLDVPVGLRLSGALAFDGHRVALALESGFLLLTPEEEPVVLEGPERSQRLFFSPNGEELWSFRYRDPVMRRWTLP